MNLNLDRMGNADWHVVVGVARRTKLRALDFQRLPIAFYGVVASALRQS